MKQTSSESLEPVNACVHATVQCFAVTDVASTMVWQAWQEERQFFGGALHGLVSCGRRVSPEGPGVAHNVSECSQMALWTFAHEPDWFQHLAVQGVQGDGPVRCMADQGRHATSWGTVSKSVKG